MAEEGKNSQLSNVLKIISKTFYTLYQASMLLCKVYNLMGINFKYKNTRSRDGLMSVALILHCSTQHVAHQSSIQLQRAMIVLGCLIPSTKQQRKPSPNSFATQGFACQTFVVTRQTKKKRYGGGCLLIHHIVLKYTKKEKRKSFQIKIFALDHKLLGISQIIKIIVGMQLQPVNNLNMSLKFKQTSFYNFN